MQSKVCNNIEGSRILDGGIVCEDVKSVTLPTISHPTSNISSGGMAADVDMPNTTHVEAMEFAVAHNNGKNCVMLTRPGKHELEVRGVRQVYNVAKGEMEHESVKFRVTGVFKSCEKGTMETNNPLGSTNKYSILRYEEIVAGETVTLVDAMAGIITVNGVNFTDEVENLLK